MAMPMSLDTLQSNTAEYIKNEISRENVETHVKVGGVYSPYGLQFIVYINHDGFSEKYEVQSDANKIDDVLKDGRFMAEIRNTIENFMMSYYQNRLEK